MFSLQFAYCLSQGKPQPIIPCTGHECLAISTDISTSSIYVCVLQVPTTLNYFIFSSSGTNLLAYISLKWESQKEKLRYFVVVVVFKVISLVKWKFFWRSAFRYVFVVCIIYLFLLKYS